VVASNPPRDRVAVLTTPRVSLGQSEDTRLVARFSQTEGDQWIVKSDLDDVGPTLVVAPLPADAVHGPGDHKGRPNIMHRSLQLG